VPTVEPRKKLLYTLAMAKKRKTREEKIRTRLRQLEKRLQEKTQPEILAAKVKRQKEKASQPKTELKIKETEYSQTPKYLSADLKRAFYLTLLAISLEVVVYWWLKIK
jgi:Skp family chaperone for outer membrane proteins